MTLLEAKTRELEAVRTILAIRDKELDDATRKLRRAESKVNALSPIKDSLMRELRRTNRTLVSRTDELAEIREELAEEREAVKRRDVQIQRLITDLGRAEDLVSVV
jgi:DNA repair exonuclease SbcCD ATPase subunit